MTRFIDLTGQQKGHWLVLSTADRVRWLCRCACGTERLVRGMYLRSGKSKSCGCYRPNQTGGSPAGPNHPSAVAAKIKHGSHYRSSNDYWYRRAAAIRQRAIDNGIDFGFASVQECATYLASIAPAVCPVFRWPLVTARALCQQSASVDRRIPTLGYVRDNIQVISLLANRMKNDATRAQLLAFAHWVLGEQECN